MKKKSITLPLIAGASIAGMHIVNKLIAKAVLSTPVLSTKGGNFFNWRLGNIYYTKTGNGKPLLLVHELSSDGNAEDFSLAVKNLSKNYTVYTIDLLGCGRSDKPPINYTQYVYVLLLTDFIRQVVQEPVDLILSGLSCPIGVFMSNSDASLVNQLILVNPPSVSDCGKVPSKADKLVMKLYQFPVIGTFLYQMFHVKHYWMNRYKKQFANDVKVPVFFGVSRYQSALTGNGNGRFLFGSIVSNYVNMPIIHALRHTKQKIVLIFGEEQDNMNQISQEYEWINFSIQSTYLKHANMHPYAEVPKKFCELVSIILES